MQANKPYISTGLRHISAIVSSQISTMMEPVNAILKHEPANRRLEISPHDISFLSSLSIIHGFMPTRLSKVLTTFDITINFKKLYFVFVVGETLNKQNYVGSYKAKLNSFMQYCDS